MRIIMRRLISVCLLLVFTTPITARRQAAGPTFQWTGSGTVSSVFYPGRAFDPADWSGSVRDDRTVQFRVRESRRVSVNDAQGRLVGEIAFLEDNGSTWTGSVQHAEVHLGSIRLSGAGGGSGTAVVTGVVYRSAVTPDPLADVLGDGSYLLQANLGGPISYQLTQTEANRKPEVSQEQSIGMFSAGDGRLAWWLTTTPTPVTPEAVRASLARTPPPGVITIDTARRLDNGRMAGDYNQDLTGDAKGTVLTASWSLERTVDVTVTLTETPPTWRPEWYALSTYTASVDPSSGVKGRFRFRLQDVSTETGIAMNAGFGNHPDLMFAEEQPQPMTGRSPDGLSIETAGESSSASVAVTALDYGAWGRLTAEMFVNGTWVPARTERGHAYASIPLDANGDHIADEWLELRGISRSSASDDVDSAPSGANTGDGFSTYEEYRGFMVGGTWTDTDPTWKDLFINNEATPDGCGDFPSTGVICQIIGSDEYDGSRVVNFNRGYATAGPQKGLVLVSAMIGNGVLGQTTRAIPNEGTPITLDLGYIAQFNIPVVTTEGAPPTPLPTARRSVIAHEIGHAVNIDHHGNHEAGSACGGGVASAVALWGGAYSGDRACFMSYARALRYQRADGTCHQWAWPHQWGSAICSSQTGTGINAGPERVEDGRPMPVSGDATHGDCIHQLRLRR